MHENRSWVYAYIALGGNIGNVCASFKQALSLLGEDVKIKNIVMSKVYETSPVSDIPQANYLNAVCRIETTLAPQQLHAHLQNIEKTLGRAFEREKNAPRIIDLDLLFYANEHIDEEALQVPHPRWRERLFVLIPLSDLTETIYLANKEKVMLSNLINALRVATNDIVAPIGYLEEFTYENNHC